MTNPVASWHALYRRSPLTIDLLAGAVYLTLAYLVAFPTKIISDWHFLSPIGGYVLGASFIALMAIPFIIGTSRAKARFYLSTVTLLFCLTLTIHLVILVWIRSLPEPDPMLITLTSLIVPILLLAFSLFLVALYQTRGDLGPSILYSLGAFLPLGLIGSVPLNLGFSLIDRDYSSSMVLQDWPLVLFWLVGILLGAFLSFRIMAPLETSTKKQLTHHGLIGISFTSALIPVVIGTLAGSAQLLYPYQPQYELANHLPEPRPERQERFRRVIEMGHGDTKVDVELPDATDTDAVMAWLEDPHDTFVQYVELYRSGPTQPPLENLGSLDLKIPQVMDFIKYANMLSTARAHDLEENNIEQALERTKIQLELADSLTRSFILIEKLVGYGIHSQAYGGIIELGLGSPEVRKKFRPPFKPQPEELNPLLGESLVHLRFPKQSSSFYERNLSELKKKSSNSPPWLDEPWPSYSFMIVWWFHDPQYLADQNFNYFKNLENHLYEPLNEDKFEQLEFPGPRGTNLLSFTFRNPYSPLTDLITESTLPSPSIIDDFPRYITELNCRAAWTLPEGEWKQRKEKWKTNYLAGTVLDHQDADCKDLPDDRRD